MSRPHLMNITWLPMTWSHRQNNGNKSRWEAATHSKGFGNHPGLWYQHQSGECILNECKKDQRERQIWGKLLWILYALLCFILSIVVSPVSGKLLQWWKSVQSMTMTMAVEPVQPFWKNHFSPTIHCKEMATAEEVDSVATRVCGLNISRVIIMNLMNPRCGVRMWPSWIFPIGVSGGWLERHVFSSDGPWPFLLDSYRHWWLLACNFSTKSLSRRKFETVYRLLVQASSNHNYGQATTNDLFQADDVNRSALDDMGDLASRGSAFLAFLFYQTLYAAIASLFVWIEPVSGGSVFQKSCVFWMALTCQELYKWRHSCAKWLV